MEKAVSTEVKDQKESKDFKNKRFSDDPISNLQLVLATSPEFAHIFDTIRTAKGILFGGCVRELVRCKDVESYLEYLKNGDIDCVFQKPFQKDQFFETIRTRFPEIQTDTSRYDCHLKLSPRYSEEKDPMSYQSDIRHQITRLIKHKKNRSDEQSEFILDREMKKMAIVHKLYTMSDKLSTAMDLVEVVDINTFFEHHNDFDINTLIINTINCKLSVKPGLKIYLKPVLTSIRKNTFLPLNHKFDLYDKQTQITCWKNLYKRTIHMLDRGYKCDLNDMTAQNIMGQAVYIRLAQMPVPIHKVRKGIRFSSS